MENRNEQRRRRRNKRNKYFRIVCILLFFALLLSAFFTVKDFLEKPIEDKIGNTDIPRLNTDTDNNANYSDMQNNNISWNLMLVNSKNSIPDGYKPNLVKVNGGELVDERIYEPLMQMLEASKEANWGELPIVVSGYRTQQKQQKLYDDKIKEFKNKGYSEKEAEKQAKQWVSVPGYSEHQIGLAVDINGATYDLYFWLQENSYKYGFIFRYPGNKTDITGTAEEVWHYRYVGIEAATEIYEQGLCLEEYLENLKS